MLHDYLVQHPEVLSEAINALQAKEDQAKEAKQTASLKTHKKDLFEQTDGTIIGKFGKGGKALGEFSTIHQMDCRDPNTIYTAEINNWRAQKIVLKPAQGASKTAGH